MGLDDMVSTESAFVAAATAAVFSPKTRETMRRGAVYGLAGVLKAGDVVAGAARGAVRGVRGQATPASGSAAGGATEAAPTRTRTRTSAKADVPRSRRSTGSAASTRRAAATARSGGDAAQS